MYRIGCFRVHSGVHLRISAPSRGARPNLVWLVNFGAQAYPGRKNWAKVTLGMYLEVMMCAKKIGAIFEYLGCEAKKISRVCDDINWGVGASKLQETSPISGKNRARNWAIFGRGCTFEVPDEN